MTATSSDLPIYSPFQVTETGPFTEAMFLKYKALAEAKLARDNPGLIEAEYDHAVILLTAHYYAAKQGNLDKKTEKIGDYWYDHEAGTSSFLLQYKQLIDEVGTAAWPTTGILHADSSMENLKLDQEDISTIYDEDGITVGDHDQDYTDGEVTR